MGREAGDLASGRQPGLFDRLEREKADFLADVRKVVQEELERFAREHVIGQQMLYTGPQAAKLLGISESSVKVLEAQGHLKARRFGSKRLYPHDALLRLAKMDVAKMWPSKSADESGQLKTVRPKRPRPIFCQSCLEERAKRVRSTRVAADGTGRCEEHFQQEPQRVAS